MIIKIHLPTLRVTVVVSNFQPQKHFLPSRLNVVVVGYESWKHLPMMVSGTVRLPPPCRRAPQQALHLITTNTVTHP